MTTVSVCHTNVGGEEEEVLCSFLSFCRNVRREGASADLGAAWAISWLCVCVCVCVWLEKGLTKAEKEFSGVVVCVGVCVRVCDANK